MSVLRATSDTGFPDTLTSVNNLGAMLKAKGDLEAAEPLYRRALETREARVLLEHDHAGSEGDPYDGVLDLPHPLGCCDGVCAPTSGALT